MSLGKVSNQFFPPTKKKKDEDSRVEENELPGEKESSLSWFIR